MNTTTESASKNPVSTQDGVFISYTSRWLMLALFCFFSLTNAIQWIHYAIISNIIVRYYSVSYTAVDWLSLIFMAVYIPLIFPCAWYLDKYGLRRAMILGSFVNMLGAWIKCASNSPTLFWVTFVGQLIAAISQLYVLGIPAPLAAVWFSSEQVSTACSIGVFGNMVGIGIGFLLPPVMVPNSEDFDVLKKGFDVMYYTIAGLSSLAFVLILIFFKDKPPSPPSAAADMSSQRSESFKKSLIRLCKDRDFVLLLFSYGMNIGTFYAISTLLNQTVLAYFPGETENAGRIGLLMLIAGMAGSVICGYILDKTAKFKLVTLVLYVMSFVSMIGYTFIFEAKIMWLVYLVAASLGFFQTGYLPVGFEFAAELTFPEPEGTTSGLLNAVAQIFGIVTTLVGSKMVEVFDDVRAVNLVFCVVIFLGLLMTIFIRETLKRQKNEIGRNAH